jgi:hypothetical protein
MSPFLYVQQFLKLKIELLKWGLVGAIISFENDIEQLAQTLFYSFAFHTL